MPMSSSAQARGSSAATLAFAIVERIEWNRRRTNMQASQSLDMKSLWPLQIIEGAFLLLCGSVNNECSCLPSSQALRPCQPPMRLSKEYFRFFFSKTNRQFHLLHEHQCELFHNTNAFRYKLSFSWYNPWMCGEEQPKTEGNAFRNAEARGGLTISNQQRLCSRKSILSPAKERRRGS